MNKPELVSKLAERTGNSKAVVSAVVDELVSTVTAELLEGGEIRINGLGKFHAVSLASRTVSSPFKEGPTTIPPRVAPRFQPAAVLKKALNA